MCIKKIRQGSGNFWSYFWHFRDRWHHRMWILHLLSEVSYNIVSHVFLSPCSFSSKSRVEQSSSIRNPLLQCTNSSGRLCAQSLPPDFDRNTADSHCLLLGQSRGDSLHHLRLYSRSQSDHLIWRRHESGNNPFPTPLVLPPLLPASWILKHESDAWQKIRILLMVTLLFI